MRRMLLIRAAMVPCLVMLILWLIMRISRRWLVSGPVQFLVLRSVTRKSKRVSVTLLSTIRGETAFAPVGQSFK